MSKWLYIAFEYGQGVYEPLTYTFDKEEALAECEYMFKHLTKQERKERELWVEGYDLSAYEFEVMPDETAQEAFKRWADSLDAVGLPDPDDYIELKRDIPKNANLRVEACEQLREAFSGDLARFRHVAVLLHANAIDGRCEERMGAFKARLDANEYAGYLRDKYVKIGIPFAVYIDGELFHDGGFYEWMEECR